MTKILFCTEKYVDCTPAHGESNSTYNLFGSLESTGLADFMHIHFDEYAMHHDGMPIDNYLLEQCESYKPDAVFFSYYLPAHWGRVSGETLEKIKAAGIKTIFIWWDGMIHMPPHLADLCISACDGITPQDQRIYNDPGLERWCDVVFWGTLYSERPHICNYVHTHLSSKYKIVIGGGQRSCHLPVEEYAKLYKQSKIVMNFCTGGQIKGRIFESMFCGALLLEQNNERIKQFFEPFVHYVPFGPPDELCEKIEYYLTHEDERLKIAQAGKEKCETEYTAKIWWEDVFKKSGLIL